MHACSCSYTDDDVSHYNNYLIFSTLWIMIIIMHCMHGEKVVNGDIKCEAN
jgi:hypothetical protein